MAKSTELLKQFQKDFGINMSIDEAEGMIRRFSYLDNFLFENPSKNPERDAYKKVLNYMFDKYIDQPMRNAEYTAEAIRLAEGK